MSRKTWIGVGAAGAVVLGWALFRPELLFVNSRIDEAFPAAQAATRSEDTPFTLAAGRFHGGAHETKGTATVHQLADGTRILRLAEFETSNGPDVRVLLVAAADAKDNDTVKKAGSVDLGALKANQGDQNYEIPAGLDLKKHQAVTIWCRRFGVNFGTAPLSGVAAVDTAAEPARLTGGEFRGIAHETKGTAAVYRLNEGKRVLRLSGFHTSNGPDVHVYLVKAQDAPDNETVKKAGFVDLGSLKANQGDQNYELPADADLREYRAVTIWCKRFGVNFGTASLNGGTS